MNERLVELGKRVKAARGAVGLTQAQLAAAVGIHRTHVVRIEAGRENITVGTLYGLADHLGVRASGLIPD
ncbi:helix-turn-helix domain-containing protein [Williamsia sp. DF01-3]|uniref:helix-turn-helix domain-containing protein n=1 Tax=Williamsia sp. DF01-3 TaxID=2934157 RepID=UPI000DB1985B|nr:helix-turn-helix transcriptional regulator [Williamsia sp. DF01-3]MCK0515634.1 helix-turn-helix domain-containing protein [Williamsia sp. DF01-3]PZU00009.1 MAG: transcriptional regulator [Gordonia sp. (in: high G+C Gram-positive bacteria)]